jgi:hypothetical protein
VLTVGDHITIHYNAKNYDLSVVDVEPKSPHGAILLLDTDVQVEFIDTRERSSANSKTTKEELLEEEQDDDEVTFKPFTGASYTLTDSNSSGSQPVQHSTKAHPQKRPSSSSNAPSGFVPFSGQGYSLK